jgi:tetratricopeptide (TPR) repeat protein
MGRMDDAETAFAKALALDPADAVSSLALGNIALMRERFDLAERFFKESIRAEDGQAEAHLNLGLLYVYKLKRPAEARPHFLKFLELGRDDPEAPAIRRLMAEIDGKTASPLAKTP